MRSTGHGPERPALWEVVRPSGVGRVAGVDMAGFRDLGITPAGLRLIPHPAVTVALVFGSGTIAVDDAAGRQYRGSLACGLDFGTLRLRRAENFECLQVRLSPVVARAVLGDCLDGAVVPLDQLWGREAARICERLAELATWPDRFAAVDALLGRRGAAGVPVDPEVSWAWNRIVAGRGLVRVDRLATELGWSRKRLWHRFRSQIGLPPKRAANLVRFDHAAHRLVAGQEPARVAADVGYVDQSHLHRDVMSFAGVTPTTVAGEPFLTIDATAWPQRAGVPAPTARHD